MARRGATTRDPKKTDTPKRGADPAPTFKYQENKAAFEGLAPEQRQRYQRLLQNKDRKAANEYLAKVSGAAVRMPGQKAAAAPAGPAAPTPESVTEEGFMGAGEAYGGLLEDFEKFDPYENQAKYDPIYSQEMERARQNIMSQFDRRNQRQFEQQRTSLQQQIAERGLDPASPAAQELMRQQNERETFAQQEAMSAAEQAADARQQQLFGQAGQTAGMRYDIFGSTFNPAYMAGIGATYQAREAQLQRQFEEAMRKGDRASAERIARMARSGGGGGQQGPNLYERMEAGALGQGYGQGQQQNPWATAAQGFAAGVGQGVTNWALK
jgi:hypothetical protein